MNKNQWMDCTGDVVTGDTIKVTKSVFGGSYRSPVFLGDGEITGIVEKNSYGAAKQQQRQ